MCDGRLPRLIFRFSGIFVAGFDDWLRGVQVVRLILRLD
jgi:hypothetical protein